MNAQPARLLCHRATNGFTPIPNQTILDSRHSMAALGLLCHLLMRGSTPGGWTFYVSEIVKHFDTGKRGEEVHARLRELESLGYLYRNQERDEMGRMGKSTWVVSDLPVLGGEEGRALAEQTLTEAPAVTKTGMQGPLPEVDLFGNPTPAPTSQPEKKASSRKKESRALTDEQLTELRDIWNAEKHPRFAEKRALPTGNDLRGLQAALKARGGSYEALRDDWICAVQQVARYGRDPRSGYWGEVGRDKAPAMANLIPHIDKHAESGRAVTQRNNTTNARADAVFVRPQEI